MKKRSSIIIFVFIFCQLIASSNYAASKLLSLCVQDTETRIVGTVTDQEGDPVPGLVVKAKSPVLKKSITIETDMKGQYQFRNLVPGKYTLTFTLKDFVTVVKKDIYIGLGETLIMGISIIAIGKEINVELPTENIYKLTLAENLGITPVIKKNTQEDKGAFYYLNKKIYAKEGIAKVGFSKKELDNIKRIPFFDEAYIRNGLTIEKNCVYAIRIGEEKNIEIMLIRVLKIINNEVKLEYYIQAENE